MTQCITKDYLFDHVIDVRMDDGHYEEAVLLEAIYDAPTVDVPEYKTFCGVDMAEAIQVMERYKEAKK